MAAFQWKHIYGNFTLLSAGLVQKGERWINMHQSSRGETCLWTVLFFLISPASSENETGLWIGGEHPGYKGQISFTWFASSVWWTEFDLYLAWVDQVFSILTQVWSAISSQLNWSYTDHLSYRSDFPSLLALILLSSKNSLMLINVFHFTSTSMGFLRNRSHFNAGWGPIKLWRFLNCFLEFICQITQGIKVAP